MIDPPFYYSTTLDDKSTKKFHLGRKYFPPLRSKKTNEYVVAESKRRPAGAGPLAHISEQSKQINLAGIGQVTKGPGIFQLSNVGLGDFRTGIGNLFNGNKLLPLAGLL